MSEALRGVGFEVTLLIDGGRAEVEEAIRTFVDRADAADAEAALFHYAGHGLQYEGVNYLFRPTPTSRRSTRYPTRRSPPTGSSGGCEAATSRDLP